MAVKIFINYRRDDSIGMAGRLHDRLAQTFGRDKLFMDVDHIPVGVDFVEHLNSQVAACDAILVVIGPHWLDAKDESGDRRLDNPDDFVAIEIAAALARDIRVIPVLVDGARMPKASQLPDSLKPLARRHAIEVRHAHFGHDAEALVARMREALGVEALGEEATVARGHEALGDAAASPNRRRFELYSRRRTVMAAAAVALLLMVGWGGYAYLRHAGEGRTQQAGLKQEEERRALVAEANRKMEEAEQQRLAAVKADQDRQARVASEAEAKRKTEEAERQRQANIRAEEERQATAAAEAGAKRKAEKEGRIKETADAEVKPKAEGPILIINDYSIRSVAFGPDGRTALSGSDNKKLKLWDLSNGQVIRTFTHSGPVTSVAFGADGRTALSGSDDKTLK